MKKKILSVVFLMLAAGQVSAQTTQRLSLWCFGHANTRPGLKVTLGSHTFEGRITFSAVDLFYDVETRKVQMNYRDTRDQVTRKITMNISLKKYDRFGSRFISNSDIEVLNLTTGQIEISDSMEVTIIGSLTYKTKLFHQSKTNDFYVECELKDLF